jgi:hypothetical protein
MAAADYDPHELLDDLRAEYSEDELYELGKTIYGEMPADWRADVLGDHMDTADLVEWLGQQGLIKGELADALDELGFAVVSKKEQEQKVDEIVELVQELSP